MYGYGQSWLEANDTQNWRVYVVFGNCPITRRYTNHIQMGRKWVPDALTRPYLPYLSMIKDYGDLKKHSFRSKKRQPHSRGLASNFFVAATGSNQSFLCWYPILDIKTASLDFWVPDAGSFLGQGACQGLLPALDGFKKHHLGCWVCIPLYIPTKCPYKSSKKETLYTYIYSFKYINMHICIYIHTCIHIDAVPMFAPLNVQFEFIPITSP